MPAGANVNIGKMASSLARKKVKWFVILCLPAGVAKGSLVRANAERSSGISGGQDCASGMLTFVGRITTV